jgi:uncharacterized membrane protein YhaH (DUF805 family)
MDFQALYTKTDGRISRRTWWIGALLLVVANVVISLVLLPLVGLGGPNMAAIMAAQTDPAQISGLVTGAIKTAAWGNLIVFLIFAYPAYCVSVKRRHDRNNNGLDVLIYFAITIVLLLVQALGMGFETIDVQGVPMPIPSPLFSVLGGVVAIYGLYLLVVLGFLKGTEGTNTYGPNPLVGGTAAAAA